MMLNMISSESCFNLMASFTIITYTPCECLSQIEQIFSFTFSWVVLLYTFVYLCDVLNRTKTSVHVKICYYIVVDTNCMIKTCSCSMNMSIIEYLYHSSGDVFNFRMIALNYVHKRLFIFWPSLRKSTDEPMLMWVVLEISCNNCSTRSFVRLRKPFSYLCGYVQPHWGRDVVWII